MPYSIQCYSYKIVCRSCKCNNEDLQLLDEIGKGQFGRVKKGLWKGMQVAVKEILLGYEEPDLSEVNLCR